MRVRAVPVPAKAAARTGRKNIYPVSVALPDRVSL